jgi:hypothetical protein
MRTPHGRRRRAHRHRRDATNGVVDDLGDGARAHGDDRKAACHRLGDDEAERLVASGVDQRIAAREKACKACGVLLVRQHRDVRCEHFATLAADEREVKRRAERREHAQQQRDFLLARHAAGEDQEPRSWRERELVAKRCVGAQRMEDRAIDAKRLDRDVVEAEITEPLGDQAARREYAVEAAIEMAKVVRGGAADRRCEAVGEEAREVRMRERDGRNAKAIGDAEHDPRQVIRIGRFDDVGFELAQRARPAIDAQRHAIAARHAKLRKAAELDDALVRSIARAGYDQRVAHVARRREKLFLGEKVSLHAAAVRREEQRYVDDVHRVAPCG